MELVGSFRGVTLLQRGSGPGLVRCEKRWVSRLDVCEIYHV